MDPFEKKLLDVLESVPCLPRGQALFVAVSGGPDSVALLAAVSRVSGQLDRPIRAVHVNHGLRGRESDTDEQFVRDLCGQLEVRLTVRRMDLTGDQGGNLEARMRHRRYDLLEEVAVAGNGVVLTAHHADDQAETVLLKLVRGAWLTGLAGIYPRLEDGRGRLRVVRPLLSFRKEELQSYLQRREMTFRVDVSNLTTALDRNWVRSELLPPMTRRLNSRVVEHLGRTAVLARETEELMKELAEAVLPEVLQARGEEFVRLDISALAARPLALRRVLIRDLVLDLSRGTAGLDFQQVEAVLALLDGASGHRVKLPRAIVACREFDGLLIQVERPATPFSFPLAIPGECRIEALGKTVCVEPWTGRRKTPQAVRLGGIEGGLAVRSRRPGDLFCSRSGRRRKLKKVFHDERVPGHLRDRLILLTSAGRIVWVEGLWPHPDFQNEREIQLALQVRDETFHS